MKNDPFTWKTFDWSPIEYDEIESHTDSDTGKRVYATPEGPMPSMTTILKMLDDGGLDAWKKRVGDSEAQRIVTQASTRGNSLHDLNEAYLKNELVRSDVTGSGKVLFNRCKSILDDIDTVLATEIPVYHKTLKFAGRVDCVAIIGGVLYIVDHKNSRRPVDLSKAWSRRKFFKYALQMVGYGLCLESMYGLKPQKGKLIVGVHETSSVTPITINLKKYRKEFLKLIHIYNGNMDIHQSGFFKL